MFDKLIHFSIYNKPVVAFLVAALVVWGVWSFKHLPLDAVPDITNNQVQIITYSPSLATQEVERLITFPIELAMASIPRQTEIRSLSRFGLSVVTVVFDDDADTYWARAQVNERLLHVADQIPPMFGKPELAPPTTGLGEIYQYLLAVDSGYNFSLSELRSIQDWVIKRRILGIEGVADVSSFGGKLLQFEIALDPNKLNALGLSALDVFSAVAEQNQNSGGAYLEKNGQAVFIRTEGFLSDLEAIKMVSIPTAGRDMPINIQQIAEIREGFANRYGALTHAEYGEAVGGIVMMLKGENSAAVAKKVNDRIVEINKQLPKGIQIYTFLNRQELIGRTVQTVRNNLLEGALIVIVILTLFLGNLRAGLIVASVIPLAMLFAIGCMQLFGVSGNLMSLGAIDFGLVVDGAVIMVEAILYNFHKQPLGNFSPERQQKMVFESASGIRKAASFGEIIILIVYVPILALAGIEGKMFKPMAQTVGFAIFGALILSLTYVPMMSAWLLGKHNKQFSFSEKIISIWQKKYGNWLNKAFQHQKTILLVVFFVFGLSIWQFNKMGAEFMPQLDEGDFGVEMRSLTGTTLTNMIRYSKDAAFFLKENFPNEVRDVVGKIGSAEIPTDPMPIEACDLMVLLKPKALWKVTKNRHVLADKMKEVLEKELPGVSFGFQQPVQLRFNELMTGAKQDIVVKIYGEELNELANLGGKVAKIASETPGSADIYVESLEGLPQLVVTYQRDMLSKYGVSITEANKTIQLAFAGLGAGFVYQGDRQFELVLRFDSMHKHNPNIWNKLMVKNIHSQLIPISQIATIAILEGPNQIQRDNTKRRIVIGLNVRNLDVATVVEYLQDKLQNEISLPNGYHFTIGGEYQNLQEAKSRLLLAVPLALALIFVLLYAAFGSWQQALLIFTAIPLSAIGGIWALQIRGMPFSISAGIGFIALFGVAVLNGIVLIAAFNQRKLAGEDLVQRVYNGAISRLRPVLLTASVASFGFLPMAIATSAGAEVQKPLATVVIGGLISATFLTLFLLPILYCFIEKITGKTSGFYSKTGIISVVFVIFFSQNAHTQDTLTRQTFVEIVNKNNVLLKGQLAQLEATYKNQQAWLNMEPINFSLETGNYNSIYNDQRFDVEQSFALPQHYLLQKKKLMAATEIVKADQKLEKAELLASLQKVFAKMAFLQAEANLLARFDNVIAPFERAISSKMAQGETDALAYLTAQTLSGKVKVWIHQNQQMRISYSSILNLILGNNTNQTWICTMPKITPLKQEFGLETPWQQKAAAKMALSEAELHFRKTLLWPTFSFGYFNQSIIGTQLVNNQEVFYSKNKRFDGFNFRIKLPLFGGSVKKQAQAANLNAQSEKLFLEYTQLATLQNWLVLKSEIENVLFDLEFTQSKLLSQAMALTKQAETAWQNGDIGYVQFVSATERAYLIELDFLKKQHQLWLLAIESEQFFNQKYFND